MVTTSPDFTYFRPATLAEAVSALAERGPAARLIAGGTDLLVMIQEGKAAPEFVIDVRSISELRRFDYAADGGLTLGAAVTLRALETSAMVRRLYPQLAQSAAEIGSVQIRSLGTVGGNLCTSLPSADLAPALITLGASVRIVGRGGERILPLEKFFTGPRASALEPDEVLVDLQVPPSAPRSGGVYLKLANRPTMDITFVGVSATITLSASGQAVDAPIQTARIALSAVAPTPIRAYDAEKVLAGRSLDPSILEECGRAAVAACRPITDARATADYRREMVDVLTRRAVSIAVERARAAAD